MLKIKKNDTVQAIKGRDAGKKGRVLEVFALQSKALVEGMNVVKKAMRKTQNNQQGGIVSIEKPLPISNLMLVCKNCSKPARVGFRFQDDKTKVRFCKACKEAI